MAGNVRFLKQSETGNSPAWELVPVRFADGMEVHFMDQAVEERAQRLRVGD